MATAVSTTFDRMDGTGKTQEFRTDSPHESQTLAYLDFNEDGTKAGAVVFDPFKDTYHTYSARDVERARAIVVRHLTAQGYAVPTTSRSI